MARENVSIPCGRISLEGILRVPDGARGPAPAGVICHPHPLFGGSMHNNVTEALADALSARGMATLLFNFRGTGRSGGFHGGGISELDDVTSALDFVSGLAEVDAARMLVAGYSFGCWVGLKAASQDPRPKVLIGVSPPLSMYDFGFLRKETRPKLLITGDMDFVCPSSSFLSLVDEIPEPKHGVVLSATDHFHMGRETELTDEVIRFLEEFPGWRPVQTE
ncbi:MAG: alpha/beta fold hydrolase [Thermodesulfobacteriota bacterium]